MGVSRAQSTQNGGAGVLNYRIAVLAGAFCIAAVVLAIHAMTTKS
jgi:preprotein translocase subunit SecG